MFSRPVARFGVYRLPSERTWSKQHPKIRTPRPLVDRFNLGNLHPNKEWWRERRIAPATFMGFPDVSKAAVRGGSLYTEQMDAATLAVIVDKCVKDGIGNEDFWSKFSWRAQQLGPTIGEVEAAYLLRAFSRRDWFDSHLALTLWARIDWLLPRLRLQECAVVIESFANQRFGNLRYEARVLDHMLALVEVKTDWTTEELCKALSVLGMIPAPTHATLETRRMIGEKICSQLIDSHSGNLSLIPIPRLAQMLHSVAGTGPSDISLAVCELVTAEIRESAKPSSYADDAVTILRALQRLDRVELEQALVSDLLVEYYDNIFRLQFASLVTALEFISSAPAGTLSQLPKDHSTILLRRIGREVYKFNNVDACTLVDLLLGHREARNLAAGDVELLKIAMGESLDRLAVLGVEKVPTHVLAGLRGRLEKPNAELSRQFPQLSEFSEIVSLAIASK